VSLEESVFDLKDFCVEHFQVEEEDGGRQRVDRNPSTSSEPERGPRCRPTRRTQDGQGEDVRGQFH